MVKRLAEINLVKGDYAATRKYLRILQKTFVWSRWANRAFSSLGRKATTDEKALLQQYIEKRPFINRKDTLRLNENCHTIMCELAESNPNNKIAIDYMLCSDLLLKDMETFKRDYVYINPLPNAETVLKLIAQSSGKRVTGSFSFPPHRFEDYNENHPHSGLKMLSPREFRSAQTATA